MRITSPKTRRAEWKCCVPFWRPRQQVPCPRGSRPGPGTVSRLSLLKAIAAPRLFTRRRDQLRVAERHMRDLEALLPRGTVIAALPDTRLPFAEAERMIAANRRFSVNWQTASVARANSSFASTGMSRAFLGSSGIPLKSHRSSPKQRFVRLPWPPPWNDLPRASAPGSMHSSDHFAGRSCHCRLGRGSFTTARSSCRQDGRWHSTMSWQRSTRSGATGSSSG